MSATAEPSNRPRTQAMVVRSVRMTRAEIARLDRISAETGIPRSEIIRRGTESELKVIARYANGGRR